MPTAYIETSIHEPPIVCTPEELMEESNEG